jgi:hypothetical protein
VERIKKKEKSVHYYFYFFLTLQSLSTAVVLLVPRRKEEKRKKLQVRIPFIKMAINFLFYRNQLQVDKSLKLTKYNNHKSTQSFKKINSPSLSVAPPAFETSHLQLPPPPSNVATKISQRRRDRDVRFGGVFVHSKTQKVLFCPWVLFFWYKIRCFHV